ncbi:MAG: phage holin family protein [Chthoniobacteraceae bacterium]
MSTIAENGNIVDLLKRLRDDTTVLVREEVALAKVEVSEKASKLSRNVGYLAAGALVGYSGLVLMLMGLGFLLSQFFQEQGMRDGTAAFLGFLIVGAVIAIISAGLVMKAINALKAQSLKPEQTLETLQEDKQWAQNKIR